MLNIEADLRPSALELLDDPWFKGPGSPILKVRSASNSSKRGAAVSLSSTATGHPKGTTICIAPG